MDITLIFKAGVKAKRTKNRAFGLSPDSPFPRSPQPSSNRCNLFTSKSRDLLHNITRLREFLLEHRTAYLNLSGHLSIGSTMTDHERDKIDAGAQKVISLCSNQAVDLERYISRELSRPQVIEHQQAVVRGLKEYLKETCELYGEQKAIRVRHHVDLKQMSRIHTSSPKKGGNLGIVVADEPEELEDISAEELQMFEMENQQLYNELNSLSDEVNQIEMNVVKIAELQEIMTEKVLQQEQDIDRVANYVVGSTENVKDANEQLRQAIQRNAGFRAYILFFLIVMSFTLLFLDWYNV